MIELLKNDDIIEKVGGRFKLTSLIQKRWLELMRGARPMVEPGGKTEMEIVMEEILQGKIAIDYEKSGLAAPQAKER
ncbi:MAG: DNA-directed RNA polymerase subunit omega [Phycisphaerae bacterium]|nr:DNA-directed RNA polymerase subunit omega [Phycisphaerae bacterium]